MYLIIIQKYSYIPGDERKNIRVVLKIGKFVKGCFLNNIQIQPFAGGLAKTYGRWIKEHISQFFLSISKFMGWSTEIKSSTLRKRRTILLSPPNVEIPFSVRRRMNKGNGNLIE